MPETLLKKEFKTVLIITLLSSTLLFTYFTPKVIASPIAVASIYPSRGHVGDTARVIATVNGTYKIFFDEELVVNGTATSEKLVNATFLIPHRFEGNYMVKLYDVSANINSTIAYFKVDTGYYINAIMPHQQTQLMEGQSATIKVSITGGGANKSYWANVTVSPSYHPNTVYYNSSLHLWNTTHSGEYMAESVYPRDFGSYAHTNYTGTYKIAFNTTLATGSFKVGLTDATQYHRLDVVAIQAANYTRPNEKALINIVSSGVTVFSNDTRAIGGIVQANWPIPKDAECGIYNVTVTSSTSPGTVKPINDTQIFTVGFLCQVQITNLDNSTISGVYVAAYNGSRIASLELSDNLGLAKLWLEPYTYSLKAFFENVLVGSISTLSFAGNVTLTLKCQLANIELCIRDKTGRFLPFILIDSKYDGIIYGQTVSGTKTIETDSTGIVNFQNTFANISYSIEAKRYGSVFNTTIIGNLTTSQQINITCPTYTLFIHVVDSNEYPLRNVSVNVTEWSSGHLVGNSVTNEWASVSLNLTFGRYILQVYNYDAELDSMIVLNKTIVDLTEDRMFEIIHCRIANVSPSVLVVDYFGQPIPNAEIKIERLSEVKQEWIEAMPSQRTDSNGVALLPSIGGDYSISIFVAGQLCGVKSVYIDDSRMLIFKIDKYVTIGGLVIETNQLAVCIALGLLTIAIGIILAYKKILPKIMKKTIRIREKTSKN